MTETADKTERLGDYQLLARIASGGMAELFLARELGIGGLERLVVIKRILPEYAEDPDFTEMFLREARIVARINDPNVVQIFELGEEEGDYFIAMEYIHGVTVAELIKEAVRAGQWLPLQASVSVMEQACKGVHQVHEVRDLEGNPMGLIHRDVSHQNFMSTDEGFVKLIDFGIAKSTESQEEATYSGAVKGKYAYMSPEQCSRDELDRRSDIFSLGVVAWELFAGRRLFKREDKLKTVQAITQEQVPPPSSGNPAVPNEIDRVVLRALRKDPGARFQTAADFREGLLDAARSNGFDVGPDRLGRFVQEVAGGLLEERRRERRAAARVAAGDADGEELDFDELEPPTREESEPAGFRRKISEVLPAILLGVALFALVATGWYVFAVRGSDAADEKTAAQSVRKPVTVGWPPIIGEATIRKETAPVWRYLEEKLGRPIDLSYTNTYQALSEKIRAGQLEFAMMPPLLYVRAERAEPELRPLVVREFDGATAIDGLILVRASSDISTVEDLRGERFCFTDRNSTTGNFLPRSMLRKRGFEPEEFLGPAQWSGSHLKVLRDLLAGRCAAAATSSASLLTAEEFGIEQGKLRQLAVTGHVPQDALVAAPSTSARLARRVKRALVQLDPQKVVGSSQISEKFKITGFSPISRDAYDELREAIEHVDE